jgi:hypothetical protein
MTQAAVDDDPQVIPVNPCTRINLPKVPKRVIEPLPAMAVIALYRAITPRYRVGVALGAGLGLREGEAFGLTVPRVDFLRRKVHVLSQAQRGQLAAVLKTDASTRTIPADDWVLNEITAHLQRHGSGLGDVIVTNRLGKVAQRNAFGTCWREAVAAATCGKDPAEPRTGDECGERCANPAHCLPKGTRFHDLRHFYASTLIAANLNPKVIQARLGHATITETMDTYGHLFPDAEDLGRGGHRCGFLGGSGGTGTEPRRPLTVPSQVRSVIQGEPACRPGSVRRAFARAAVIHLGLTLPTASCGLPAGIGRAALKRSRRPVGLDRQALLTLLRVGFT